MCSANRIKSRKGISSPHVHVNNSYLLHVGCHGFFAPSGFPALGIVIDRFVKPAERPVESVVSTYSAEIYLEKDSSGFAC